MKLTNLCSVGVTSFGLELNVTLPVPQKSRTGLDAQAALAWPDGRTILAKGVEFPFGAWISGEEDDARPIELTVNVLGLTFWDGTAAGDASWVKSIEEARKKRVQEYEEKLELIARIAHLDEAKALLSGEPDPSRSTTFRLFWRKCKRMLSDDPVARERYVNYTAFSFRSLKQVLSQHLELIIEGQ